MGTIFGIFTDPYILNNYMQNTVYSFEGLISNSQFIVDSFLGYSLPITTMWLFGFTKFLYFNFFIISFKGISLGFVSSNFIFNYGLSGLSYVFIIFLPQTLILVFTYFFININVFKFRHKKSFIEYFISFVFCMAIIFLISMYEAFLLTFVLMSLS